VFEEKITNYQSAKRSIVYLDESGFALDMPRDYGYSAIGQRCFGQQDWQAKGRINVIGAIQGHQLLTTCLFEGNINSDVFHAWITQDLLPKLPQATVIVMDNATFHKRQDTQLSIQQAGHTLEYLPAYSPDLNPIEHKWAQAKALRKKYRCNVDDLFKTYL
jgi:transposase